MSKMEAITSSTHLATVDKAKVLPNSVVIIENKE